MDTEFSRPVTAVIVGGGHRSIIYGDYSFEHPDELKIVGIADPNRERCLYAAKRYGFSTDMCFSSAEELASHPKMADAIINGTMDHQHFATSVPLLRLGYHMLLEKPFAVDEDEMREILTICRENSSRVMIGHVLRYSPFYTDIRRRIKSGELGEILNIQMSEHVSYHHLTNSYVRGKWANSQISKTSMLLAKSCHDIDLMAWLMSEDKPVSVSSFGAQTQFVPGKAPEGAADRCVRDNCPYLETCNYSSKRIYLDYERWTPYVWQQIEGIEDPTYEQKLACLTGDNDYDRCVYKCDNNVVDRQSLLVNFASGATGTHNMIGGTARSVRKIHVIGTLAELEGAMEDGKITIRRVNPSVGCGFDEETLTAIEDAGGHGGGDELLTRDFIRFVRTGETSISTTAIEDSVYGHLIIFRADKSRENGGKVMPLDFEY